MPLELQVKLLRVLETGTFSRVGSTQSQEADVRVIAASNRPPETAVAAGKLREDLLYRLNVFPIHLPPLRDRADDIGLLAEHFLAEVCQVEGVTKRFTREAVAKLERYRWPGNVRELRNVVQRAYVMTNGDTITDEWLPINNPSMAPASSGAQAVSTTEAQPQATPAAQNGNTITVQVGTSIAEAERQLILATFAHCGHNKERTAAALGISLKTLYNRLKEFANDARAGEEPRRTR
jgi:two-component system response regulator AtoC